MTKLIISFTISLFLLNSCTDNKKKITAAYFHGFNCPDANSDLKTEIEVDIDLMTKALKSCKFHPPCLPKSFNLHFCTFKK